MDMYSEALRVLDENTVQLMIDELKEAVEVTKEEAKAEREKIRELERQLSELRSRRD